MNLKLNKKQIDEITKFLKERFGYFETLRSPLDTDIKEEVDLYNDIDKYINEKQDYEKKFTIPYIYTIVQTMVARLIETFFGKQNYLRIYVEDKRFKNIEKSLQLFLQEELDKAKFKSKARDFLEDALIQRTTWLQPRLILNKNKLVKIDINVLKWFDVWFDTKAKDVEDSDFFVRKIVKFYKLNKNIYFNLEELKQSEPPDYIRQKQEYKSKHGVSYYDPVKNNATDEVELLEYYGWYDIDGKGDFQPVIFTLGNREVLIRAEICDLDTHRKILLFPVRPVRQANSLIGKSIPQIIKQVQYALNETISLTLQNFELLIKLLFKYRRGGSVDFDELFARGGNAIGWEDSPDDITIFDVPNMVQLGLLMISQLIQIMQQTTGAVDYLMGTSAGRGITETASGIRQITEQAMFKFNMMAQNVYSDLLDLINYILILLIKYDSDRILTRYPELADFFEQSEEDLENSYIIDIGLNDLTMRRDIERSQFINATNILAGLINNVGGDMKKFLKLVMERLEMENIDEILYPPEQQKLMQMLTQNPALLQQLMMLLQSGSAIVTKGSGGEEAQKRGGSLKANPQAEKESMPEEESLNEIPEKI